MDIEELHKIIEKYENEQHARNKSHIADSTEFYSKISDRYVNRILAERKIERSDILNSENAIRFSDSMLFKYGGDDIWNFRYILKHADLITNQMFTEIIEYLLDKYHVEYTELKYDHSILKKTPVLIIKIEKTEALHLFVRGGIDRLIDYRFICDILNYAEAKEVKIISLAYENIEMSMVGEFVSEEEYSRYESLEEFFIKFFNEKELKLFKLFEKEFVEKVDNNLGFILLRSLTPYAMYGFKKILQQRIVSFNYIENVNQLCGTAIDNKALVSIDRQYIQECMYKALMGKSIFAESFITAEWLYYSMSRAGYVDYTVVAAGYYKAIEQLIYSIIVMHKDEGRTIKNCNKFPRYIPLTTDSIESKQIDSSLGSMIAFLKYGKNRNLLHNELDEETIKLLLSIIGKVKGLRNGYFHKDNIDNWKYIEDTRKLSLVVLYILLGAYKYSNSQKDELKIIDNKKKGFRDLCEYVNRHPQEIFYVGDDEKDLEPVMSSRDPYVKYDHNGEVTYSGVYFGNLIWFNSKRLKVSYKEMLSKLVEIIQAPDSDPRVKNKYDENNVPRLIYTGKLLGTREGMEISGPDQLVFKDGMMMIDYDYDSLLY